MMGSDPSTNRCAASLPLGLTAAADGLARPWRRRAGKPGYTEFLHDMLTTEVAALRERRLAGRMRFAEAPRPQDPRTVRLHRAANPGPPTGRRPRHAEVRREKANCSSIGPPGVGKTSWLWRSATRRCTPATASTTQPPRTSLPAPRRRDGRTVGKHDAVLERPAGLDH